MNININNIKQGLNDLAEAVDSLSNQPAPTPKILDRELSGNKINGGMITNFSSVGIIDEAKQPILTVHNDGITVDKATIRELSQPVTVQGNLTVNGEVYAKKLHVDEVTADIRNERTTPLEFKAEGKSLNGKGLIWSGKDYTKQFVFQENIDRFWSSEDIDLQLEKVYRIDRIPVLTLQKLGDSVVNSKLRTLGKVENLETAGSVNIDDFVFWDSDTQRLGIGTDQPNAMFSVKNIDHEFVIDNTIEKTFKVGTWTTSTLEIISDDTTRIEVAASGEITLKNKVHVEGKLGIGVKNPQSDVDLTVAGPVRIQNKKFQVGSHPPTTGPYLSGDIVWNNNPQPTGYVGWICTRPGSPGEWKAFGLIES